MARLRGNRSPFPRVASALLTLPAMPGRTRSVLGPEVAIVSRNAETLDGLGSYLRAAGVTARSVRDIDEIGRVPPAATVFVLFPDDFRWESVVAAMAELKGRGPATLPVLVTGNLR